MSRDDPKNYSADWWTPPGWKQWVTNTLGTWFDPCPPEYRHPDKLVPDGLHVRWQSPFYCNHPGSRGSVRLWWPKFVDELDRGGSGIWCAFNHEQTRIMEPSPWRLEGWMVMPRKRISYIRAATGERAKSPAQWSVFWSSVEPAYPPQECVIVRTGA